MIRSAFRSARRRLARGRVWLLALPVPLLLLAPRPAVAQYQVVSPAGDTLLLETAAVREMLDSTRAMRADLEQDPGVMYRIGFGDRADTGSPSPAWPWNAIEVRSDSVVDVTTPGNLREASRAFENYSVMRMRIVRSRDPDVDCDRIVEWEAEAVSSFVDGWIVARTLFGGPPFDPLDAFAFARLDGHLPALIVDLGDRQIGACAEEWAESHPAEMAAYRTWHERQFPSMESDGPSEDPAAGEDEPPGDDAVSPESTPTGG